MVFISFPVFIQNAQKVRNPMIMKIHRYVKDL